MNDKYLFRTDINYEQGQDIRCKDPDSTRKVQTHVGSGSRAGVKTQFISTTTDIVVANIKYGEEIASSQRPPIVLISADRLREKGPQSGIPEGEQFIYDFTDEQQINNYLAGKAANTARADREVVINRVIPKECCREIPPILVDILTSLRTDFSDYFEMNQTSQSDREAIQEVANKTYSNMLDMIMEDREKKIFDKVISKIRFNKLEEQFIKLYYEERGNFDNVAQEMFGNLEQGQFLTNAIQTEIIKKIVKTFEFTDLLYCEPEIDENPAVIQDMDLYSKKRLAVQNFQSVFSQMYVSPLAWQNITWQNNYVDEGSNRRKISSSILKKEFVRKSKERVATSAVEPKYAKKLFGVINLNILESEDFILPSGMEYEIDGEQIISAVPQYITLRGEDKQFNTLKNIRGTYIIKEEEASKIALDAKMIECALGEERTVVTLGEEAVKCSTPGERECVDRNQQSAIAHEKNKTEERTNK